MTNKTYNIKVKDLTFGVLEILTNMFVDITREIKQGMKIIFI